MTGWYTPGMGGQRRDGEFDWRDHLMYGSLLLGLVMLVVMVIMFIVRLVT